MAIKTGATIKQLKPNMGKIDINLQVTEAKEPRNVFVMGKPSRVAEFICTDGEGDTIPLVLWNDEIDEVEEGNYVRITNGYCKEFQGKKQLTIGKFGKMEVKDIAESVR